MVETVLRTGDELTLEGPGPSSFANVLTILPLQHRGFWETPEIKNAMTLIQSDIRDQLQELRVESSGEQIASLASGLSLAAASSIDKHAETYISEFSSRLGGEIPKVSSVSGCQLRVINPSAQSWLL